MRKQRICEDIGVGKLSFTLSAIETSMKMIEQTTGIKLHIFFYYTNCLPAAARAIIACYFVLIFLRVASSGISPLPAKPSNPLNTFSPISSVQVSLSTSGSSTTGSCLSSWTWMPLARAMRAKDANENLIVARKQLWNFFIINCFGDRVYIAP